MSRRAENVATSVVCSTLGQIAQSHGYAQPWLKFNEPHSRPQQRITAHMRTSRGVHNAGYGWALFGEFQIPVIR
jgi:hypothetical protein